ncbi:MAG: DUF4270 domain-containing protein [Prevotellaceae bacterium]|jgi:hypothetical protein|nr:DUF4270 domain-containing protein [Prevotellaceae bacterium]
MKKLFFLLGICVAIASCKDDDSGIGLNILPESDEIMPIVKNFNLASDTKKFDGGVYANNTVYLLGEHENSTYGATKGSLLAGVTYPKKDLAFPPDATVDSLVLRIAVASHIGNEPLTLKVSELNTKLIFGNKYPTDIDVTPYIGSELGSEIFPTDSINRIDTLLAAGKTTPCLYIKLSNTRANDLIKSAPYTSETAFQDYFKGIYIEPTGGKTVLYIDAPDLLLTYHYTEKTNGKDTVLYQTLIYPSNNEVKKVNAISHGNSLDEKFNQKPDTITYLFSPAGFYSQVNVPINSILIDICNDPAKIAALNSVRLTIEAEVPKGGSDSIPLPNCLALVPESEINTYFEQNKLPDNKTSFYAALVSNSTNKTYTYTFDLMTYLQEKIKTFEYTDGSNAKYKPENFALVPALALANSSSILTDLRNNPYLTGLSFNNKKLKLTVIYSNYHQLNQ